MKALERKVKFYDLRLTQSIRQKQKKRLLANFFSLKDFLSDVENNKKILDAAEIVDVSGRVKYRLDDLLIENDKACLLFSITNGNESDISIQHLTNRKSRRIAKKTAQEGNAYSGHLCINLKAIKKNTYSCLFEEVPNFPISIVDRLLGKIAKNLSDEPTSTTLKFTDKNTQKTYQINYKFESKGHPNDTLKRMLSNGEITSFEVIDEAETIDYWDSDKHIYLNKKILKLKADLISINQSFSAKLAAIKSICKRAKKDQFDSIRIGYKSLDGDNSTLPIDPDTEDIAIEKFLIRTAVISNFTAPLPSGFDRINTDIKDKMFMLI